MFIYDTITHIYSVDCVGWNQNETIWSSCCVSRLSSPSNRASDGKRSFRLIKNYFVLFVITFQKEFFLPPLPLWKTVGHWKRNDSWDILSRAVARGGWKDTVVGAFELGQPGTACDIIGQQTRLQKDAAPEWRHGVFNHSLFRDSLKSKVIVGFVQPEKPQIKINDDFFAWWCALATKYQPLKLSAFPSSAVILHPPSFFCPVSSPSSSLFTLHQSPRKMHKSS